MREHPIAHSPALHTLGQKYTYKNPKGPFVDPACLFAFEEGLNDYTTQLLASGAVWKRILSPRPLEVDYPEVDWQLLRRDHGWAALQYEILMRGEVHIPADMDVRIDAEQAVEYAFVSKNHRGPVEWYNGDIYGFASTPTGQRLSEKGPSNFARSMRLSKGDYKVLIRGLYEIRMFGDPKDQPPKIKINFKVWPAQQKRATLVLEPGVDMFPDSLEGQYAGDVFSIGVRLPHSERPITIDIESKHAKAVLPRYQLFPGQTRAIPLRFLSHEVDEDFRVKLIARLIDVEDPDAVSPALYAVHWRPRLDSTYALTKDTWLKSGKPLRITFGTSTSGDTNVARAAILPPPDLADIESPGPALLCLHGAGVDIEQDGWVKEIPRLKGMFAILATGRNEWGEDWHGGAVTEVWAARRAADAIVHRTLEIAKNDETVLLGHSNGGQGVWHVGQRYPDRVRGIVALAGYTTIHNYVPYTEQRSNHFADPALLGVLQSSLTPYNNEIYVSNLASVPMIVVHGAEDDNVPAHHSRTYIETLRDWGRLAADVTYVEVPKKGHYWDGILTHPKILEFLENLPQKRSVAEVREKGFSLACANPDEMSSKGAIRILELAVPGRLARLDVNMKHWGSSDALDMHGMNVKRVSVGEGDKTVVMQPKRAPSGQEWEATTESKPRRYGPMIRLLGSDGPMLLVIPNETLIKTERNRWCQILALAINYAHDVRVYQRQDVEIVYDIQALRGVLNGEMEKYGSIIVFGRPDENRYAKWMIGTKQIPGASQLQLISPTHLLSSQASSPPHYFSLVNG